MSSIAASNRPHDSPCWVNRSGGLELYKRLLSHLRFEYGTTDSRITELVARISENEQSVT